MSRCVQVITVIMKDLLFSNCFVETVNVFCCCYCSRLIDYLHYINIYTQNVICILLKFTSINIKCVLLYRNWFNQLCIVKIIHLFIQSKNRLNGTVLQNEFIKLAWL